MFPVVRWSCVLFTSVYKGWAWNPIHHLPSFLYPYTEVLEQKNNDNEASKQTKIQPIFFILIFNLNIITPLYSYFSFRP